jgi:hypothetical protein
MAEALNITLPIICTNGAMIYDFQHQTVLHQDTIDPKVAIQVLSILDQHQTHYLLYTTQSIVSTQSAKTLLESRIGVFESLVVESTQIQSYLALGLLKILIIEPDDVKFSQLRTLLSAIEGVYVLSSQASFIDVGNIVANKGRALKILCEKLGIPLESVLSIGDQENDLTMIQLAGIGVAMGDGEATLKQQAKFVTKSFKEDGFTHAIKTFIFKA